MKNKILITGFLIFSIVNLFASHKMGADIQYVYLGANKYKFITKFYRDCKGISFENPEITLEIGSNNGNTVCASFPLTPYRVSIKDVTQICSDSSLPCSPQNTTIPNIEGVEEHVYENVVDFSLMQYASVLNVNTCSEITVYFSQCCRNGSITTATPGNFIISTTLYWNNVLKTPKKENNSVIFSNLPIIYACCNVPFSLSQCAIDTSDYDSVSFNLVHPIETKPNVSVNYNSPFTKEFPMTPYCPPTAGVVNCNPLPNAQPPRGFYFDSKTGDIIFTPTNCEEVGILVIEANEFRKDSFGRMLQVGKSRRDMEIIVKSCGQNISPKITGSDSYIICEGQKLCFDISVKDSSENYEDSLIISWNDNMKDNSVIMIDSSSNNKKIEVCWTTKIGDAKNYPYLFSLTASDNVCPFPIKVSKTFKIQVKNCLSNEKTNVQNDLNLNVYPNPAQNTFKVITKLNKCDLSLFDVNGKEVLKIKNYINGDLIKIESLNKGFYTIKCSFENHSLYETLIIE